ncbi:MAG: hypothetical protein IKM85_00705 [Bacteroidales bacterium]|nr:hypothetical protein [Bacteroidales bacterium]
MNNKKNYLLIIGICLFMLKNPNNCWSNNAIYNDDLVRSSSSVIEPCLFVNDVDSITVLYWNAWGCNYDQYTISYSLATGNMVVYVEYLKSIPAYPIICSEQIRLFLSSIDAFYLKKSIPIVEKKIKQNANEHLEYDIPTFHVECYKKGKRVLFSSTLLEDGDYELVFNPMFEEFKSMVFSIVDEYDRYVKKLRKKDDSYRCRYY